MPPDPPGQPPHAAAEPPQAAAEPPYTAAEPPLPPPGTSFAALLRIREYLRPYYGQLIFMLLAAMAAAGTEIVIPLLAKAAIDGPIRHHHREALLTIGLAAAALGLAEVALNLFRRWIQASAVTGMERSIRDDLYAHLQRLEPGFHDTWQSGQLLSRATTDLSAIRRFAGFGVIFLITNFLTFALVVTLLISLNWRLGLLTGCMLVPVAVICLRFEGRYRVLSRRAQDQQGDLATYVEEAATGIRVLKALGRREEAAGQHRAQAEEVYRTQLAKARLRGTFWAGLDLVPNAVIGLILLLGAFAVAGRQLTIGGVVAFITLTLLLVWPIEAMGYILALGQEAATAAQRIYEIFDTGPAISDPARTAGPGEARQEQDGATQEQDGRDQDRDPAAPHRRGSLPGPSGASPSGAGRPPQRGGRLVFDHVRFCYPRAPAPVLRDVCLEFRPGETVALVGATGCGKTTLLELVPRLADVTAGAIRLDGTDVRSLRLRELRSRVGCAFEDPTLFSASVRENVAYGAPDAAEADIEAALAAAQAGFVHELPWGLDTRIGEQGMSLSGGQRQRVALARAILARPPVLLLDDPLSALDVQTEAKVTAALRDVLTTSTTLIVAHRPSTVLLADRVALLAGGVITAQGTHRELLAADAGYRALMSPDAHPDTGQADSPRGTAAPGQGGPGLAGARS